MVNVCGYSTNEVQNYQQGHVDAGEAIKNFLEDIGEDCDIVLEFDDDAGPFQYLFTGTSLSLEFDYDGISVLDYNFETDEELTLAVFAPTEINKATHWLLTLVNQAK